PTASASHWLLECRHVVPLSAHSAAYAAIPVFPAEILVRPGQRSQSVPSSPRPPPVRPDWLAPRPMPPPAHPSDRSGHTTHKTGTSVPAWLCGPASASAKRLSPTPQRRRPVAVLP